MNIISSISRDSQKTIISLIYPAKSEWLKANDLEKQLSLFTVKKNIIMKAMMLTGIRAIEMREVPDPKLQNPGDVKIKMLALGVCGSDIHYYTDGKIGSQVVQYPFTVGHEGAGVVIETGSAVTRVKKGDIVAIDPAMPCWTCDQCKAGRHHTCRKLKFLGCPGQAEGCLSEFIVMPQESCFALHHGMTSDQAAISEPLSIGVYAVRRSIPMQGARVGILGYGPIGMSVMLAARAMGAETFYVTDKIEERLKMARQEGVAWAGHAEDNVVKAIKEREPLGLDVVFECCGQQEAVDQAIEIAKPGGKIMIVGIPEFDRWSMDVDDTRRKEITFQFVRRQVDCVQESLDLIHEGKIKINRMITHRFSFAQAREAFDLVAGYEDGVMKAMIDF